MIRSLVALEEGRLIAGRYRLLRPLGFGGSACVWAARDESLGREVAIKALTGSSAQGGQERERLRREARTLALLDHPSITAVYDFVEVTEADETTHPILVTKLLDGVDLSDRLKQGPLPEGTALSVCAQVADALAVAHGAGVVHRDVKPGNVILTADGAKLLDFGISRRAGDSDLTGPVLIGTPACMAPEQWRGQGAQPSSDVYALGCLLFWCLTGEAPFAGREMPALGMAHLIEDPPRLPAEVRVGETIRELYRACTRKEPDDRPSASEVSQVLISVLAVGSEGDPASTSRRRSGAVRAAARCAAALRSSHAFHSNHARLSVVLLALATAMGAGVAVPVAMSGTGPGATSSNVGSTPTPTASHSSSPSSGVGTGASAVTDGAAGRPAPSSGAAGTGSGASRAGTSADNGPVHAPEGPHAPGKPGGPRGHGRGAG